MLLSKIRIVGHSMEPTLKDSQIVFASSIPFLLRKPKVGDIVVLQYGRCIIKRIARIKKGKIFVVGDNVKKSTDSRNFGWIDEKKIAGKVIFKI
jgi:nickel-type superoxide dismutase maturation protease